MQGRKRDTDMEDSLVDTPGEGESGTNAKTGVGMYTLPCVKQLMGCCTAQGTQLCTLRWPGGVGWGESGQGAQDGGTYVYIWLIHIVIWQILTTLQSNHPPIKNKKEFKKI